MVAGRLARSSCRALLHDGAEGDRLAVLRVLAAEGQDAGDQLAGAPAGLGGLEQAGPGGVAGRDVQLGELQLAEDAGEDVVEIMGDAAGERAEGLHLLACCSCASRRMRCCSAWRCSVTSWLTP